jgi:aminoglycoside phosphotransferase (APT) family kinase protein
LRILQSPQVNDQDSLELFCLKEASKLGISPKIHYVSSDGKVVLMDYIQGRTLSMAKANLPENVVKLAQVFLIAHQITGHPSEGKSLLFMAQMCFSVIKFHLVPDEYILPAYELTQNYTQELQNYDYEKVHVHGDLSPRNIFLTDNKVYLIDWAETTMEDPFYDLAFFSLMLCYGNSNEELLLSSYLERPPTNEEWHRYNLHKKIHQAFWSMTNLYRTHIELKKHPEQRIIFDRTPKSWEFYQKIYSDYLEEIPAYLKETPAQYFYDFSRLCYQRCLPECP